VDEVLYLSAVFQLPMLKRERGEEKITISDINISENCHSCGTVFNVFGEHGTTRWTPVAPYPCRFIISFEVESCKIGLILSHACA
jgi:hypothetical protein